MLYYEQNDSSPVCLLLTFVLNNHELEFKASFLSHTMLSLPYHGSSPSHVFNYYHIFLLSTHFESLLHLSSPLVTSFFFGLKSPGRWACMAAPPQLCPGLFIALSSTVLIFCRSLYRMGFTCRLCPCNVPSHSHLFKHMSVAFSSRHFDIFFILL